MTQKPEPQATGEQTSPLKPALSLRSLWVPLTVVVIAIVVIVWMFWGGESSDEQNLADDQASAEDGAVVEENSPPSQVAEPEQPDLTELERHDPEDPLATGDTNAPVTMIVFSDYQCPYCSSWSQDTLPTMMDYVDDDQLRIEWRDLNVFGPASTRASRASYAAALQDEFWEFHHALFPDGDILSEDELSSETLIDLADELGLDTEQFATDMNSDEVEEQVDENAELGYSIGAYSTPTFIVGGTPVVGAQPTEVFTQAVEDALAEAGE